MFTQYIAFVVTYVFGPFQMRVYWEGPLTPCPTGHSLISLLSWMIWPLAQVPLCLQTTQPGVKLTDPHLSQVILPKTWTQFKQRLFILSLY